MTINQKIKKFFKEVFVEMKKVTWLSKKDVLKYTGLVLLITIVVSAFLGFLDYIFMAIIKSLVFE